MFSQYAAPHPIDRLINSTPSSELSKIFGRISSQSVSGQIKTCIWQFHSEIKFVISRAKRRRRRQRDPINMGAINKKNRDRVQWTSNSNGLGATKKVIMWSPPLINLIYLFPYKLFQKWFLFNLYIRNSRQTTESLLISTSKFKNILLPEDRVIAYLRTEVVDLI